MAAFFNTVVGELNLGKTRLSKYGYTQSVTQGGSKVEEAVTEGFLKPYAEPPLNAESNAVVPEEVGILNASLPVPMAYMSALATELGIVVGFGQTGQTSQPVFANQLYLFDGSSFQTQLTKSTAALDGNAIYGIDQRAFGILS